MFSRRTQWDRSPSPLSRALGEARAARRPILDLTESNPTRVGLAYPWSEIAAAFGRAARDPYEPESLGLASARAAVGAAYAPRANPSRILLTASTSEAYSHLFRLLADPGDVVLVPRPSYPLFGLLAELDGIRLENYRLREEDDWRLDWPAFDALAGNPRVRAVVVVCPNNPTGSVLCADDLVALAMRCERHGWALVADEVFVDYLREGESLVAATGAVRRALDQVLWFSMGGLSKSAGLPGAKLAWTFGGGPRALVDTAFERLEVIADTYLSPSMSVQVALPELLALAPGIRAAIRARIDLNLASLGRLEGSPVSAFPVGGGWSVMLKVPRVRGDEEWALALLERHQVLIHPGRFFDTDHDGTLVASLLPEPERFGEALDRLVELAS